MNVEQILQEIGLEDREIKIYLALLELGESTVLPISKKSGIKRTYCYDILASLIQKRLVTFFEQNGRRRYVAEDPALIQAMMRDRLARFGQILPELRSIHNRSGNKPKVRYYEGAANIGAIFEEIGKSKECYAISSPDHVMQYMPKESVALGEQIAKRNIRTRELYTRASKPITWMKHYLKGGDQEVRYLPAGTKLAVDILIWHNKLAMISYEQEIHAVVLESSAIVASHRALFEVIWSATPPESV